jgi:hypothetical protein
MPLADFADISQRPPFQPPLLTPASAIDAIAIRWLPDIDYAIDTPAAMPYYSTTDIFAIFFGIDCSC